MTLPAGMLDRPVRRTQRNGGRRETEIVRAILGYLSANRILAWRSNTGAALNPSGRLVRFGVKGMPDIAGILPGGRACFIEVKRPGKTMSPDQQRMQERLARAGALAFVATCIEDVRGMLKLAGVGAL